MREIMPILVLGGMVLIFVFTYWLNKRTPIPESVSEFDKAQCASCNLVTCSYNEGTDE